jgi:peptidyl-prolyl cis-trans isomerase A (cyclophilin A)
MRSLVMTALAVAAPFAVNAQSTDCSRVKLTTTQGPIVIQLDPGKAPASSANFAQYVKAGHYNGTVFHRVIPNFMIQGGGFTSGMTQKETRAPIRNEAANGLKNDNFTVAMARTSDPNSATSQFFINVKDNDFLNYVDDTRPGYAVFGRVVEGMETVAKIKAVPTTTMGPHQNVPSTPVVIEKAECVAAAAAAPAAPAAPAKK